MCFKRKKAIETKDNNDSDYELIPIPYVTRRGDIVFLYGISFKANLEEDST